MRRPDPFSRMSDRSALAGDPAPILDPSSLLWQARRTRTRVLRVWVHAVVRNLRQAAARLRASMPERGAAPPLSTRTVNLGHDQLLVFEDAARTHVRVIFGGVWLTHDDDRRDYLASAGDELMVDSKGRAILGALMATRLEIRPA